MSDTEALDLSSFPLVNPGKPTSLRRSHSVVSLPTPPTTIRKRPRSRASSCYDSDEKGDAVGLADDVLAESRESPEPQQPKQQQDKPQPPARKRRRVDPPPSHPTATADEEEFWGPARPVLDEPKPRPRGREQERAPSITASASRAAAAITLPSPPPTRPREPVTPPPRRVVTPPPRTEKGKDKTARPVRDSPHNPFLESPAAAATTAASTSASPVGPKTPLAEPPTLTYVFRGKKQIFVNPAYNAPRDPRADLPETHPEYSPGERVEPRKLFTNMIRRSPTGRGNKAPLRKTPPPRKRSASPERDAWDSDSDADEGDALPMPMLVPSARLADKLAHAVADDDSDDEAQKSGKRTVVDSDDEERVTEPEPKKAPTSLHASAAIREKIVVKVSREGGEKAISKVHAAVNVQDKGRATASRRRDGEPRLVLAPTRAPTAKQSSFSPAQLDDVEEEAEEEDESEHEEESVEHTTEDPWALPPAF